VWKREGLPGEEEAMKLVCEELHAVCEEDEQREAGETQG
jgi:hypothetical protein